MASSACVWQRNKKIIIHCCFVILGLRDNYLKHYIVITIEWPSCTSDLHAYSGTKPSNNKHNSKCVRSWIIIQQLLFRTTNLKPSSPIIIIIMIALINSAKEQYSNSAMSVWLRWTPLGSLNLRIVRRYINQIRIIFNKHYFSLPKYAGTSYFCIKMRTEI